MNKLLLVLMFLLLCFSTSCEASTKPKGWEDDENGITYPLISKVNGSLI